MKQSALENNSEKIDAHEGANCRDLARYDNGGFDPGRGIAWRLLWYLVSSLLFESAFFPLSSPKRILLRLFGAKIGCGVVIKPHVKIKYPWRLSVGRNSWIGEEVWIDNLAEVQIGSNVCLSQGVYLCTGSHDHRKPTFDLITRPITLEDGTWICAKAILLPGVTVESGAVVGTGSVVVKDVNSCEFVAGVPAKVCKL